MTEGVVHSTLGAVLAQQAQKYGERSFLTFEGRDYSFAEIDRRANRIANALAARGIGKGDHVALFLGNHPEFLFLIGALARLGAVAVPLNTAAKGELLDYFLRQSEARALVTDLSLLERAQPVAAKLAAITDILVVTEGQKALPEELTDFDSLDGPESAPEVEVGYKDRMFLMYTSGTTGPSKGVMSPHSQGLSVGAQVIAAYGYTEDDVIYTCLPLFHGNALWYSLMPALIAGARLVLSRRFSGSCFWEEITACGATQANALGAMANIALKEIGRLDRDKLKLRQMMVVPALGQEAARPLTEDLGIAVTSLFAQTETFAVTLHGPDEPAEKAGASGRARDHVTVTILDDDDNILPAGETGEIGVRPNVPGIMMDGYFRMPEETLKTMSTLWFHTGDRGYLDEDGYLYFVDRKKDAIRRRGENISAYELEMIVCSHTAIREAAAVAVPSELGEDDVLVCLVLETGASFDPAEIIRFCDKNMPYFMVPRYLEVMEALPKTSSEKIEKYRLREWAAERMEKLWDREMAGITLKR
ncbi:ATP-dependent acyl-CoA ligase [Roseovarius sp. TE539]|uniref:AMP-binding protein n=1 Tax=Roseovarius sp. TE539 TaxID=2249812 RepID=UPI000DDD2792|nr:AMP-binding protein [Roseovarius sp. TE539]RBI69870.1 ATP-dependent acyl-CoA ligase [Roseovarius sp. TE539]